MNADESVSSERRLIYLAGDGHEALHRFDNRPGAGGRMGIVAPAGTAQSIIARVNREVAKILQAPDIRERLAAQGLEAATNSPEQFAAYIAAEVAKWARVIRLAGIVAD